MLGLDHAEIRRYSRHLILPEVGLEGQKKLKNASVLLIGVGGLGSPSAMYLAAAGIGKLGLVDFDVVDESNLQRQVIHGQSTLGVKKVHSARARIADLNPGVEVVAYDNALSSDNALDIFRGYDVVADGTDNFPTRYLVNDACALLGIPNVYGSIFRFEGQLSVFDAKRGPCYRCLYSEPPPPGLVPSCAEGGVLGILPGVVGMLQATEAIKLLLGIGGPMIGRLMLFDALSMRFRELTLRKDPNCVLCGPNPTVTKLIDYQKFCGVPARTLDSDSNSDRDAAEVADDQIEITAVQLKERLRTNNIQLVDVREPHEWEIGRIEGAALIPLSEFSERVSELPVGNDVVLYCKSGVRSLKALHIAKAAGQSKVKSLRGGINAWSREIDPSVPLY